MTVETRAVDIRTTTRLSDQRPGLRPLFLTEMWERFSYYGMRALLVLFMVDQIENGGLGLTDQTATAIYGLYTASIYLASMGGGWIADRLLGAHRTVWYGGILIMFGHFTLAIPAAAGFYPGLLLLVIGTGLLKPNISAMVGNLYTAQATSQRDSGFILFYMGINLGALLGPLVCSWLGEHPDLGWHYGFGAAGIGMALGLMQFYSNRKLLLGNEANRPPTTATSRDWKNLLAALTLVVVLCLALAAAKISLLTLAHSAVLALCVLFAMFFIRLLLFSNFDTDQRNNIVLLGLLCLGSAIFWSGFEQAGSSLNLFAQRFTQRDFYDFIIPAGWFQSLNPLFVILLGPLFVILWPALAKRGWCPNEISRFALALLLLGLGFFIMVSASERVLQFGSVLPIWLISTFLIHTIAELCLSPLGLSAVSRLAPSGFTGQLMGLWFLSNSLGSLLAGLLAGRFDTQQIGLMPSLFNQIAVMGLLSGFCMLLLMYIFCKMTGKNPSPFAGRMNL